VAEGDLTFNEAVEALDVAYRLGGVAAAQAVMESQPAFQDAVKRAVLAPLDKSWNIDLLRSVVTNAVQEAIHVWTRIVAQMAPEDRQPFMTHAAKKLAEEYSTVVEMAGMKLMGMSLMIDTRSRRW
jgi:hypothetical protein